MKKISLSILLATSLYSNSMQSFLDDTISAVAEEPGYYESQTRGLYSFGGAKVRYNNMGSFSPVNIQMPSLNMGCGGIDAVFGGISYLDKEYLVDKLKAISAAAPAFAFQMALGVLCEDCKTTLNWLENAAAAINNFNLDTCAASERLGNGIATSMGLVNSNQAAGHTNNFIKAAEEMKSDFKKTYGDSLNTAAYYLGGDTELAKKVTDKKSFQGSLLENSFKDSKIDVSIFGTDKQGGDLFISLVRAMIGDIVGYKAKTDGDGDGNLKLEIIASVETDFEAFLNGSDTNIKYIHCKTKSDNYGLPTIESEEYKFIGLKKIYQANVDDIVDSMRAKSKLTDEQRKFINSMPLPIAKYLNTHILTTTGKADIVSEYIAIVETKAILDYIARTASNALTYKMMDDAKEQKPEDIYKYLMPIRDNISKLRDAINKWYISAAKKWNQDKQVNDYYIELEQRMKVKLGNSGVFNSSF